MSSVRSGLLGPTGGLVWHGRALRRAKLWSPFTQQIESWLDGWSPRRARLLLVGPSAGWCLPGRFFQRFESIHAVDLDPAARLLFAWRHGGTLRRAGVLLKWSVGDFFADPNRYLGAPEEEAVLLCNVAGQLRYLRRDPDAVEADLSGLRHVLTGRDWASFHDLLSGRAPASSYASPVARWFAGRVDGGSLLAGHGLAGEWLDHLTGDLLPADGDRLVLPWRFAPDRLHFVEAGCVSARVTCRPS